MPQRKKPFSGKAKKEQLKAKKQSKQNAPQGMSSNHLIYISVQLFCQPLDGFGFRNRRPLLKTTAGDNEDKPQIQKFNYCPSKDGRDRNRYALQFYRESPAELKARKEEACKTIEPVSEKDLEIDSNDYFPKDLSFPRRPPWSYDLTPEQLEAKETKYFNVYIQIYSDSRIIWHRVLLLNRCGSRILYFLPSGKLHSKNSYICNLALIS